MDRDAASVACAGPRLATRLVFFAAGFALACWAPLVPFAKANVRADDAQLGLLLLCLGFGSLVAMPVTGWISANHGAKPMVLAGGAGLILLLPLLVVSGDPLVLATVLFLFGAALGTIDVAMNVHGVEVERREQRPLMSSFHAMFSAGGIAGAGGVAMLLTANVSPATSAVVGSTVVLLTVLFAASRLLPARGGESAPFAMPHGIVLLIATLAGIMFLVEGAVLDWGALLIVEKDLGTAEGAGVGYMLFSIAMTIGRLTGDGIVSRFGDRMVVLLGGVLTTFGIVLLLAVPWQALAYCGFLLIGLGAANIVPVLLSHAGRQTVMPVGLAVASVTTAGYAGMLLGPAAIGFVAELAGLPAAFWILAALVTIVPLSTGAALQRP